MMSQRMIDMIKRFTDKYGVEIKWNEQGVTTNSRGVEIPINKSEIKTERVLLLKEQYNPLKVLDTGVIGLSQDYARYLLTLSDIDIKKDLIITDSHNRKWKLGAIDWFDVGGVPIAKQSALTEVM